MSKAQREAVVGDPNPTVQTCEEERRPSVPKIIGKNYYTHHLIRRMPLKLEHIRPKKSTP
jgi:hypothetical protein